MRGHGDFENFPAIPATHLKYEPWPRKGLRSFGAGALCPLLGLGAPDGSTGVCWTDVQQDDDLTVAADPSTSAGTPNGSHIDRDFSIGLVLTGGTIGAEEDGSILSVRSRATRAEVELLTREWPGPGEPHVTTEVPLRKLSENLVPSDWLTIASSVRKLADRQVDGVLVLHGTDTMAYTAAALSFLLSDLEIPIVVTGSLLPSGEADSDAALNVRSALVAMQELQSGTYVTFADETGETGVVHLGTRVRKLRASDKAFTSVNRDVVGVVHGNNFLPETHHKADVHHGFNAAIDERVLALRLYPGLNLDAVFNSIVGLARGVVIELYASATGPDTHDQYSLPGFIQRCRDEDILVATTIAQAPPRSGKIYETTVAIDRAGGLFLWDMLPETATVKLMWALAQSDDLDSVKALLLEPIAGEISPPE